MNKVYQNYAKNIFSQNGEDGILVELLDDLNIDNGYLVDIGAWNGIYLNNIYNIWRRNFNYTALLVERDELKFKLLKRIKKKNRNIIVSNKKVQINSNSNNINEIIKKNIPSISHDNFTLIVIDVDSFDYQIFQELELSPKIVVIEHTMNEDVYFEKIDERHGSSFYSIYKLAISKGYELICDTHNSIYIRKDLYPNLVDINPNISNLACSPEELMRLQKLNTGGKVENNLFFKSAIYKKNIESELFKNFTLIDKLKRLVGKFVLKKEYSYV